MKSWLFFDRPGLADGDVAWIRDDVAVWRSNEGYQLFSKSVQRLCVVIDPAERTVKLIQDFVDSAHEENRLQNVLLAVTASRKVHGDCTRKSGLAGIK